MTRKHAIRQRYSTRPPANSLAAHPATKFAHMARLRRALYRFLSAIFLPPREERHRELIEAAQTIWADRTLLAQFQWYLHWQPLLGRLTDENPPSLDELLRAYTSLFVVGPGGRPSCPLYASSYLDPNRRLAGVISLHMEQIYRTTGFALSPQIHDFPDHLAIELEFAAVLCEHEAEAWETTIAERVRAVLQRERYFLERFVGSWLPELAHRLVQHDTTGLYSAAADASNALVQHDLDLLAALLSRVDEVQL